MRFCEAKRITASPQTNSDLVLPMLNRIVADSPKNRTNWRSPLANLLVVSVSAGLLLWSVRFAQARSSAVISVDAVINGNVTDLKTPEEGQLARLEVKTGEQIAQGNPLFTVTNDRNNQLPLQEITTRINQYRSDLNRAQARLDRQIALQDNLAVDDDRQQGLEVAAFDQQVDQMDADLRGAEARQKMAQLNLDRIAQLHREGAIPTANLDNARIELEQRQSEVQSLISRRESLNVSREAALQGLSLSKTRSNYDPRIRLQEAQIQIADAHSEVVTLQQRLNGAESELATATKDMQKKQTVIVKAPSSGVIWKLSAQEGKYLQRGESIGQIADCNQRWVDAIVDENAVKSLQVGLPAEISLHGTNDVKLNGKIAMIRSGLGRTAIGEDVSLPTSPNAPRQSQVRVELNSGVTTAAPVTQGNLCYLGYTGRVTFKIKEQPSQFTTVLHKLPIVNALLPRP
jgi:multidrug resistance efflux pump